MLLKFLHFLLVEEGVTLAVVVPAAAPHIVVLLRLRRPVSLPPPHSTAVVLALTEFVEELLIGGLFVEVEDRGRAIATAMVDVVGDIPYRIINGPIPLILAITLCIPDGLAVPSTLIVHIPLSLFIHFPLSLFVHFLLSIHLHNIRLSVHTHVVPIRIHVVLGECVPALCIVHVHVVGQVVLAALRGRVSTA